MILASSSAARRAMLENCGVDFTAMPADLDEDELMLDWQKNHVPAHFFCGVPFAPRIGFKAGHEFLLGACAHGHVG
ncbi:MAG: hypothetical protein EB121_06400 [Alphaproteobacteria bacterium]|nr:hypothetical protein [Alphaproteobacteria bacterium]